MKEIIAIIRQNKVNVTKSALAEAGIPSFTCRRALGRGKKLMDPNLFFAIMDSEEAPSDTIGEYLSETNRLIPKRIFTTIIDDDQVELVVDTIMEANSTGNPGDGKIFVLPILENYRVRNGEITTEVY
ncbi:P-II family nitrogen regulator [Lachnospiraceae bacterium MD1]|jgi:nitrogen regulatory protein PII 2|uniref:P-II family nitrogen regulator n=1 Tax=Variimorphobacter saccharofermentans TaxID=2755051 RepID=A0A839JZN9_9FIRM|nr:P-II family nitrogen regulator [Variimorphobacter saccharofermentans]MBB2182657.1 P-II family nitrogen regulator [Variimorphobacter saccharofermentans]